MKKKEVELNDSMVKRLDELYDSVYKTCRLFLALSEEAEETDIFPWNMEIIGLITDITITILKHNGYAVCYPYIEQDEDGERLCHDTGNCEVTTCKCKKGEAKII